MSQQIHLNTLLLVAYHNTVLVYTTQSLVKRLQVRLIKKTFVAVTVEPKEATYRVCHGSGKVSYHKMTSNSINSPWQYRRHQ